jgi:hypothetical protein
MTPHHPSLVAALPLLAVALTLTTTPSQAAGSRAGATSAAKRHTVAYVKRYGSPSERASSICSAR